MQSYCSPVGGSCNVDNDCCSTDYCDAARICRAAKNGGGGSGSGSVNYCSPVGGTCNFDEECCSTDYCDNASTCRAQGGGGSANYCSPVGGACDYDGDCCSTDYCSSRICRAAADLCLSQGATCLATNDCCQPWHCVSNKCDYGKRQEKKTPAPTTNNEVYPRRSKNVVLRGKAKKLSRTHHHTPFFVYTTTITYSHYTTLYARPKHRNLGRVHRDWRLLYLGYRMLWQYQLLEWILCGYR
jgi:hypothetical protein